MRTWFYSFVILGFLVATFGAQSAFAARPDSLKDILSDSRPSVTSIHDIYLDQATGTTLASGETILIDFPSGFTGVSALTASDVTLFKDGASTKTVQSGACGSTDTVRFEYVSGQQVRFTACNSYSGTSGSIIQMTIGSTNKVTNNTAATYQLTVSGTYGDSSQDTAIAIITGVTLSATIDESLTHTTAGVTTGNCPNPSSAGTETEVNTSGDATTVPFGTISSNAFYGACQQLTVSTNASSGYTTTVKTTTLPTSGSDTISEGSCDGACSDSSANAWATNTNNGYGYCMSNQTGTPASTADSAWSTANNGCDSSGTTYFKTINRVNNSESGQDIMKKTSAANADSAYIKYRISVSGSQSAGSYSTTIIYTTTATF